MAFKKLSSEQLRRHKGISFPGITTVFICYNTDGQIFLAKRSKNTRDEHGRWDAGAGGLKHGQSLEENLRREVKEEYSSDVLKIDFLGYSDAFRQTPDGQPTHWLAMYFAVLVDPEQMKINEPHMVDDSGWFSPSDLPNPMHSQFPTFYAKLGPQLEAVLKAIQSESKQTSKKRLKQ